MTLTLVSASKTSGDAGYGTKNCPTGIRQGGKSTYRNAAEVFANCGHKSAVSAYLDKAAHLAAIKLT